MTGHISCGSGGGVGGGGGDGCGGCCWWRGMGGGGDGDGCLAIAGFCNSWLEQHDSGGLAQYGLIYDFGVE